jgi:tetratricopeptide (TPR) repeat protein
MRRFCAAALLLAAIAVLPALARAETAPLPDGRGSGKPAPEPSAVSDNPGGETSAGESAPATDAPALSPATVKVKTRLDALEQQVAKLAETESQITFANLTAQTKAMQSVPNAEAARREIAKGRATPALKPFLALHLDCLKRWRAYDKTLESLLPQAAALPKMKGAEELGAATPQFEARVREKRRLSLLKLAELEENTGNTKAAIDILQALHDSLPPDAKALRRDARSRIGGVYERVEDWRQALPIFAALRENMTPDERYADPNLQLKTAGLYERTGDPKSALAIYKDIIAHLKPGMVVSGLDKHVEKLEGIVGKAAGK